jgi:hypothetical protein
MRQPFLFVACLLATPYTLALAQEATVTKDAMTLPVNRWTKISDVPPDPFGRELEPGRGAYWCFAPTSGVFLRYGGYTPTDANDLWSFDLAARKWENVVTVSYAWPPPADRPGAGAWWSMAYDSKRRVIWMHGGSGVAAVQHKELYNDLWQYDLAAKTFKPMKSKNWPAFSARIVYDSKNDLVLRAPAYDGEWGARHNQDTTWVYDPDKNAWEGRATKGAPKVADGGVWVFDASVGKAVFLATTADGGPAPTWTYDAAANAWEQLKTETSPPARVYAGCAYDPEHRQVLVYGGVGKTGQGYGYAHRGGGTVLNDTWVLDTAKATWTRIDVGAPVIPTLPGNSSGRFIFPIAMDYDVKGRAVVVSAPTFGVWALRLFPKPGGPAADEPSGAALPELKLAALPEFDKPTPVPAEGLYPQAPLNQRLLDLAPNQWVQLGGGPAVGGGEVPMVFDEATGFCLRYGGCNDGGTTFASGYGNDLTAYDPATERWMALRWTDPCAPPRPHNGCTRFYVYDPVRRVTWFAGGTAGNRLAASLPPDWKGAAGAWQYDGRADRFNLVPSTGPQPPPGVADGYDRTNNLVICVGKQQWGNTGVFLFDPEKKTWMLKGKPLADVYTYGCYVDSLKGLLVVEPLKEGKKSRLYDSSAGEWRDLAPKPDLPADAAGRPTLAYDRDADLVLGLFAGRTFIYDPKANAWSEVQTNKPGKVEECLVYDTRHKVFLATHTMGQHMWTFRYKK